MRKVLFITSLFFILALCPAHAKADTITLGGTVTVTGFQGGFSLSVGGFNTPATTFGASGFGFSISGTNVPRPTFVSGGQSINLSGSLFLLSGDFNFFPGSVTVNGTTLPIRIFNLQVQSGSVTVPFTNDDLLFLTAACTVNGSVTGGTFPFSVGAGFNGLCNAEMTLTRAGTDSSGFGLYNFQSITYNLSAAPTPEPATIILLGSGMIGVIARVARRRKR